MNKNVQTALSTENSGLSPNTTPNVLDTTSWETLNDSIDMFVKLLKFGRVRGVVSIVDPPNSGSKDDSAHIQLTQELINRDILVTIFRSETENLSKAEMTGANVFKKAGDGLAEFCDFIGIQPVLYIDSTLDNPDILEFYNDLAQRAAVEAVDLPAAAIAPGRHQIQSETFGAVFTMEDAPEKTADLIDKHIHDKRTGVQWCDRCGGCFSPFS